MRLAGIPNYALIGKFAAVIVFALAFIFWDRMVVAWTAWRIKHNRKAKHDG